MDQKNYQRANVTKLQHQDEQSSAVTAIGGAIYRIRWFIIPLSVTLCLAQSFLTLFAANFKRQLITSTLIPVVGFAVLTLLVLAVNPLLRLIRVIRPFSRAEIMCVFASLLVTSGISAFGLTDQLIPMVSSPWNPDWNTPQTGWSQTVLPHLNPKLYLYVPDDVPAADKRAAIERIQSVRTRLTTLEASDALAAVDTLQRVLEDIYVEPAELDAAHSILQRHDAQIAEDLAVIGPTVDSLQERNASKHVISIFRYSVPGEAPLDTEGWNKWLHYYVQVYQQVPWSRWAAPLGYWLIFVFAFYGAFYFLTYVVLGYWTNRDKLLFPLARLPQALLGESDKTVRWIPPIFTTGGFWVGFAVSFGLLSFNAMADAGWMFGMNKINMGMGFVHVAKVLKGSIFEGLTGGSDAVSLQFLIVFTAIGISFLLSTEVSFSIWFYFLVGKGIILVAVWMGYGQTGDDFPANGFLQTNVVTSQGAGGLLFFSLISLLRCLVEYGRLAKGKTWGQRFYLFVPVIGLGICLMILVSWLCWNWWPSASTFPQKLSLFFLACLFVLFLTVLTLGLMRIVAESGVYWIMNIGGSYFHLYTIFGLGAFIKAALMVPLIPIYSILFLDVTAFIAPNIANAVKIQEDVHCGRLRFHLNLWICIVLCVVFSLAGAIYIGHQRGANQMVEAWYSTIPKSKMNTAAQLTKTKPHVNKGQATAYAAGAGWVGLTIFLRRSLFWFPHPVGYMMMGNLCMNSLWFSFLLGWIAKTLAVKYGGKVTFDHVKVIFIGLIMGELIAVFFWPMLTLVFDLSIAGKTVTLYRYNP